MNKQHFMKELAYHLKGLSSEDRNNILQDYEDHFKIAQIEGRDEQSVILELDSPRLIAQKRLTDFNVSQVVREEKQTELTPANKSRSPMQSLILALVLIIFNVVIVFVPAIILFFVWFAVWGIAIGFSLTPIVWVLSLFWRSVSTILTALPEFFVVLTLVSVGVLLIILMIYVTKILFFVLKGYLKWNVEVIRG
ncbi:DUF1700 domain-containing protein [Paraliobacillus salinarum]|uniref:DUF1700 domain-containing protein n=1 Tax=Paraliobacillus salinarum TaxID=1158996 RepID=UPI0015F4F91A|nr:DUF1700 domain-containing protein [Paraliobacillus salinarum]